MRNLWDNWPELQKTQFGTTYIQTPDEKWGTYFSIWRRAIQENKKTPCPCPMPFGHIMFEGKTAPVADNKQMELF